MNKNIAQALLERWLPPLCEVCLSYAKSTRKDFTNLTFTTSSHCLWEEQYKYQVTTHPILTDPSARTIMNPPTARRRVAKASSCSASTRLSGVWLWVRAVKIGHMKSPSALSVPQVGN